MNAYINKALRSRLAFSLVELSIVLVILGLLTGGILAGRSLVHAAELRGVSTEYQRFITARRAFQDKYFALPGDMASATSFWGKDATYCNSHTGTATSSGTCNGNGDGMLDIASAATSTGERVQFWRQLVLAGLLEGTYTGITGPNGNRHMVIGTNIPASKLASSGWSALYADLSATSTANTFSLNYGNHFMLGGESDPYETIALAISPEDSWNIDTKLDDGKPASGRVIGRQSFCTDGVDGYDSNATYLLSNSSKRCTLRMGVGL